MDIHDIKKICKLLTSHQNVLLITHKNPDGDAIGSTAALAKILEKTGKNTKILYPEEPPERLKFILSGRDYMTPDTIDTSFSPDLIVTLDCAAASRLGVLEEAYASRVDLSVDHHLSNTPFAKKTYTDPKASAASELVYSIAKELEAQTVIDSIDADMAFPMYAGISSDTGSFKYSNTTAHTFNVCADLIKTGIDIAKISRLLFDTCPISKLRAEALGTERLKLYADGKIAVITMPEELLADTGITYDDCDDVVNIARKIAGVEVGIYLRNAKIPGVFKVSMRSNEHFDVASICALHDGGGHLRAAGCAINSDTIDEAADIILKDVLAAL